MSRLGASRISSVLGLNVRPSSAIAVPSARPPQASMILCAIDLRRASLTATTVSTMRVAAPASPASRLSATVSLGKQLPPKPGPAWRNFCADAAVEADPAGHRLDVGADLLAQIGHLVDEGDLGREKGVGRVLDQLGALAGGEQHRRLVEEQRPVDLAHHFTGARAFDADDDAVGAHEIADRGALAQELGIGGDVEIGARVA